MVVVYNFQWANPGEYSDAAKGIVIFWALNVFIQCIFHVVKFIRFKESTAPDKMRFVEYFLDYSFMFSLIALLNVISFASYAFALACTILHIVFFFFCLFAKDKIGKDALVYLIPNIWSLALFMNYWINNQTKI